MRCPYKLGDFVYKLGEPRDYEYLLLCDGSTISEENYLELCELLGGTQLPNLIGRVLQGDSVGGNYKAAGLPNIVGTFAQDSGSNPHVSGAFRTTATVNNNSSATGGNQDSLYTFNANWSNTIYGASTTVQPPAFTTKIYICYAG